MMMKHMTLVLLGHNYLTAYSTLFVAKYIHFMGGKVFSPLWVYMMSGMHDYDKTRDTVIQDDEHVELTMNKIFL